MLQKFGNGNLQKLVMAELWRPNHCSETRIATSICLSEKAAVSQDMLAPVCTNHLKYICIYININLKKLSTVHLEYYRVHVLINYCELILAWLSFFFFFFNILVHKEKNILINLKFNVSLIIIYVKNWIWIVFEIFNFNFSILISCVESFN